MAQPIRRLGDRYPPALVRENGHQFLYYRQTDWFVCSLCGGIKVRDEEDYEVPASRIADSTCPVNVAELKDRILDLEFKVAELEANTIKRSTSKGE